MSAPITYDADGNRETALARARRFFADNPGEMLTRSDLRAKLDCCPRTVRYVARTLIAEGSVKRDQLPRQPRPSQAKRPVSPVTV